MYLFSINLNHHWMCKKQKKSFQTILIRSDLQQVKGNLISSQTKLKKLLTKQKHALRIIFNVNYETSSKPLFQELNALKDI